LQIQYNNRNANTSIVGTTANYLEVRKYELEAGKHVHDGTRRARARVAVVGPAVAQLLGFDNPIALVGEQVRIRRHPVRRNRRPQEQGTGRWVSGTRMSRC
jgi:putative ABC transport system permease protein